MSEMAPQEPQQPESEAFQYQLLRGHHRTDGSWKTDRQLRMEYLQLTDGLIRQMTDGISVEDPQTGEERIEKPDMVVWLDKSARPLAWFTKELWPKMATDPETGEVPKMPDFKFVNIDREQWVNTLDPEGVGLMNINRVDQSIIRSLRSIFVSPEDKKEGLTEAIDAAPALLDSKTIMIVDEVYSSGRTLEYASAFFKRAFPTARVGSAYWMRGIARKEGATGNADLPVWYTDKHQFGRGVGNRNDRLSSRSKSMTQRLGRYFLSVPLQEADPKSGQLRRELHELATNPDVPVLPSIGRADKEDRMRRYSAYNGGQTPEQVLKAKSAISAER